MSGRGRHLTRRFFGSLRAREPDAADTAWVRIVLTPAELTLWEKLGRADRAESVAVARRAAQALGPGADPSWHAAAMLHDVGKTQSELGPMGRAGATVIAAVVSHGRARRYPNRIGRYVAHDDLGAEMLQAAGARPEAVAWAAAHHRPDRFAGTGLPAEVAEALAAADDA